MAFELDLESEWDKFCEGGDISYASTVAYALLITVLIFSILYFKLENLISNNVNSET